METTQPERRKRGSLKLPVQRAVAVRLVVHWGATAVVAVALTVLFQFFADPMAEQGGPLERLRGVFPMALALAVAAPMASLDLARFAHRFAGPVLRLTRSLRDLAAGRPVPPVKFRKDDFWHDLAEEFNAVSAEVARLRARVAELEATHQETRTAV